MDPALRGSAARRGRRTSKIRLTTSRAGRVDAAKKVSRRCAQPMEGCAARADTTIGTLVLRNGYAQRCVGHWCRQLPVGAASGLLQAILAAPVATCAAHLEDRAIAEPGAGLSAAARGHFY